MQERELTITENELIAKNIYRMSFCIEGGVGGIKCGQFVNLSLNRADMLLRRPFGLCSFDKDGSSISICYQVVGKGTEALCKMKAGQTLYATLPLGNGFTLSSEHKRVALIGGGVGVFPLNSVPLCYPDKEYFSFLGYRSECFACMKDEFGGFSRTHIATDDGSLGKRGNAVELFLNGYDEVKPDIILACGPTVMLKSLKTALQERKINIPAYVSLEERMGCGVGACLVCVCRQKTASGDINHARVCKDGPVFDIMEVEL